MSGSYPAGSRVHFVGIGGAGMCALAEGMARAGVSVSGSDLRLGASTEVLRSLGVALFQGHAAEQLGEADAVVRTAAVGEDNPEVSEARARGLPIAKRAEALGQWVARGTVVAVAGTHGKTSTTTMATEVLTAAGRNPTAFVGGAVRGWGSGFRPGGDELFVVEADEYDRSFHTLRPDVAIVTNVEADHLDIYDDLAGVDQGFRTFLAGLTPGGTIVACGDDVGASRVVVGLEGVVTYGTRAGSMLRIVDLEESTEGTRFALTEQGTSAGSFTIGVPGRHNVLNGVAAAAAARALGVEWEPIRRGLAAFVGVGRRFERLGRVNGIELVDDYAHHPTEVAVTLAGLRQAFPDKRLVMLFQPHLYSRTQQHHEAFAKALAGADRVWITDVYPAREPPIVGVTGQLIADDLEGLGHSGVRYHPDIESLHVSVAPTLEPGDVCVTVGAGSVEHVGPRLLQQLEAKP